MLRIKRVDIRNKIRLVQEKLSENIVAANELPNLSGSADAIARANAIRTRVLAYMALHRMPSRREVVVLRCLCKITDADLWLKANALSKNSGEIFRHLLLLSEGIAGASAQTNTEQVNSQTKQDQAPVASPKKEKKSSAEKTVFLIDCENVCYKHPVVCSALAQKDAKVVFFVSEHSQGLAGNEEKVRSSARATVEFVPCVSGGKNSMDFQIVAHIGVVTATVPKAKISIISNDRGYEPAIHIFSAMGRNVCCIRPADVESR